MLAIFKRVTRRTGKGEGGQSLVEFALVLPIFLLVLFAIIDFGMAFHAWLTVSNSAREGARVGAVGAPATEIEQRVRDTAESIGDDVVVTVTNAEGLPGESVVVDVSYEYTLITPLTDVLGLISVGNIGDALTVSSKAEMRLE
jgi:hypothetical protein